jgi:hypothetical protein
MEFAMTTIDTTRYAKTNRQPWLPAINMLLAVAAVVISVFALATVPDLPTVVPAPPIPINPASNPLLPGCNLGFGTCDAVVHS